MTLHLNEWGLIEKGFKKVAEYDSFEKGHGCTTIKCYKHDDGTCVVRVSLTRGVWDHVFKNSESANNQVKYLLSLNKWYKKTYWKGQYIRDAKIMKSEEYKG